MTKKCLIEIYGVRLILKYDKTIVLEDVLSTLSKKCNLKTQFKWCNILRLNDRTC